MHLYDQCAWPCEVGFWPSFVLLSVTTTLFHPSLLFLCFVFCGTGVLLISARYENVLPERLFFYVIAGNSGTLPALLPEQARKLKQLSVLTLAESTKVRILANLVWYAQLFRVAPLSLFKNWRLKNLLVIMWAVSYSALLLLGWHVCCLNLLACLSYCSK
jgi:hypothetical protein